jgi:hypothetical protein
MTLEIKWDARRDKQNENSSNRALKNGKYKPEKQYIYEEL